MVSSCPNITFHRYWLHNYSLNVCVCVCVCARALSLFSFFNVSLVAWPFGLPGLVATAAMACWQALWQMQMKTQMQMSLASSSAGLRRDGLERPVNAAEPARGSLCSAAGRLGCGRVSVHGCNNGFEGRRLFYNRTLSIHICAMAFSAAAPGGPSAPFEAGLGLRAPSTLASC